MTMTGVEVEVVDDAYCQGRWVNDSGCHGGRVPVLKLCVDFNRHVVGEVIVQADSRGVDEGVGGDEAGITEDETWIVVIDFAAAKKEIDVGMEPSYWILDLGAKEEVLLAADVALVDGIGSANFEGWPEGAKGQDGKVGASGDCEVFAAVEVGESAGRGAKGGELKPLGSGWDGLCTCGVSDGPDCWEKGELY